MTIHAAGTSLSASQILNEINVTSPTTGSWLNNETALRELAQKLTGTVKYSDFYSKTSFNQFAIESAGNLDFLLPADGSELYFQIWAWNSFAPSFDYTVVSDGVTPTDVAQSFIAQSNIALRATSTIEVNFVSITLVSGTAPDDFYIQYQNGTTFDAGYALNTWTVPTLHGDNLGVSITGTQYAIAPFVMQVVLGVRWQGNASTAVYRTLTFEH